MNAQQTQWYPMHVPSAAHHKAPLCERREHLLYVRLCTAHPARSSPCSPTRKRRIDPNVWTSHKERIKTARVTCGLRGTRSIVRNKRGGILRVSCDPLATRVYSWNAGESPLHSLANRPLNPGPFLYPNAGMMRCSQCVDTAQGTRQTFTRDLWATTNAFHRAPQTQ